ncbi:chemotaxis protein CheW [Salinisphaera hydrothermalis]|nr:chemotaxis protein CheW [Salinisphaera hydrothermalis]
MTDMIAATDSDQREVLVFTLGGEEYAVDILKVQEIRGYSNVTRIANVPDFIKGVTNLRGAIVPIVDLRLKFALGEADYTEQTVVIVLNIGERVVGVVVDSVSDVIGLSAEQIKPAPEFGGQMDTAYLEGLASIDDRMLILIDAEAMMTSREMALVESLDAETA